VASLREPLVGTSAGQGESKTQAGPTAPSITTTCRQSQHACERSRERRLEAKRHAGTHTAPLNVEAVGNYTVTAILATTTMKRTRPTK
jgi:hypothetical protein